ncbi:HesA/MoeB/ThiF family protein [Gluconobacter morbifer]|uniref:Molybdopterin-synthase adenylyltransferase n=1 Tax=Gluconobacter morbifer G707 TaxID=1088869 RepID=G6XIV0_9PROT|nr:HesA/MoeB/ThiF family protein [Gluconobacter morbifer]EHH68275.1 molybdopterin biosynthesis MoeB protein [Gluconobacter morbifer G707]
MSLVFSDAELERYSRHILLPQVGATGQNRLRNASVLLVGAGGLGAPLAQQLAASGIGRIGLMDDDRLELSNLQRQVLYATPDLGRFKADAAAERLQALNPLIEVVPYVQRATGGTLDELVPRYDLVCDGTDNFPTRVAVSDACVRHGRTLVSGAVQGFAGQLAVFRPQEGGPCYRCLFPDAERTQAPSCGEAGVLGAATGVMGSLMAVEVMREVMGLEGRNETRVMLWDALAAEMRSFVLTRDPTCPVHGPRS